MTEKVFFLGINAIPDFYHPERKKDEVFLQFIGEEEINSVVWKTLRLGKPETHEGRKIFPAFAKRSEAAERGFTIVPVREDMRHRP